MKYQYVLEKLELLKLKQQNEYQVQEMEHKNMHLLSSDSF